ncbi:MAG: cytochrome c [Burkholderiales bacterium]|nr:cytochrome c [Burkholderiales bacterium]
MVLALALAASGALGADIQRGATLYGTYCKSCHGANGQPVMPLAPNFRRMERLMQPDMQLMASIRAGKGAMPAFFGVLREREILDVIAYLRTLS